MRVMEGRDIHAVFAIQSAAPEAAQWKAADYERWRDPGVTQLVAERDGRIVGFLVARQVAHELEILNLAVAPLFRRQGIGRELLRQVLDSAATASASNVYLEVRSSNKLATAFYQHHGFQILSRRARYYAAPVDDALVLALQLKKT